MAKFVTMIGWADVPHLRPPVIDQEELDALERSLLPHQRQARTTGRPALGAGAIYQIPEDEFVIDPVPIPDWWERAYGMDVGWQCTAAVFGARNPETGEVYLTGEYIGTQKEPVVHAFSIRAMMPWELTGAIDPAADGSNQRDGRKLREEYEELGLNLVRADNAVEAGIHRVTVMLQTGRLKVFRTLTGWLKEYRLYRRDEKGKVVKERDHEMDSTRYLCMTDTAWGRMTDNKSAGDRKYGEF